jgi:nucleotide-binding universal stress UspA family protein
MFSHVILPLDGSSLAECVLPHATTIADIFHSEICIIHVLHKPYLDAAFIPADPLEWRIDEAVILDNIHYDSFRIRNERLQVSNEILEGNVAENILSYAHHCSEPLILLSSHGRGGSSKWCMGSVALKVVMRARTSVMVVRDAPGMIDPGARLRYHRILVPVDCSRRAEFVLPLAAALACAHDSEIYLLHAALIPEIPRQRPLIEEETRLANEIVKKNQDEAACYLSELQARLGSYARVKTFVITTNSISQCLHDFATENEADLVLMNAHGCSGDSRWLYGSIALNLLTFGTMPLMVVQDYPAEHIGRTQAEIVAECGEENCRKLLAYDKPYLFAS